jgi:hypothetical protein
MQTVKSSNELPHQRVVQLLWEGPTVIVGLDPTIPCLEWVSKGGVMDSFEFKESQQQSLHFFRQFKAVHPKLEWFVDSRLLTGVLPEDLAWHNEVMLPHFLAAGLTREAFAMPQDFFGSLSVEAYAAEQEGSPQTLPLIKMFSTPEEAKNWLKS